MEVIIAVAAVPVWHKHSTLILKDTEVHHD